MKKTIAFLLALALIIAMSACGGGGGGAQEVPSTSEEEATGSEQPAADDPDKESIDAEEDADKGELYRAAAAFIKDAQFVSLNFDSINEEAFEIEDIYQSSEYSSKVQIEWRDGNFFMVSENTLTNKEGDEKLGSNMAWYLDGNYYQQNIRYPDITNAVEESQDSFFALYTGTMTLPPESILSEEIAETPDGTLITLNVDPASPFALGHLLINEYIMITGQEALTDVVATALVDADGIPIKFTVFARSVLPLGDDVSVFLGEFTVSSTAADFSFEPLELEFPPQSVLDTFDRGESGQ
jgi:hypothetical protein